MSGEGDQGGGKKGTQHHSGSAGRGVTRPMVEQQRGGHERGGDGHAGGHADGHGEPYSSQRYEMLHMHHGQTLWVYWTIVVLGVWMLVSPVTFGHLNEGQWRDPSGGRGVWFSDQTHTALRAQLMVWSDVLAGLVLVLFGWRSLRPNRPVSLWVCCFAGIWLSFAPLVLWAPTAAAYLNDTIVGILVIALTVLIPGMPNMMAYMKMGPPTPPGWSYNPSSWPQRWIMIALGFAGFVVSRYLAAFQLGYIQHAWDPFFGESTRKVLNSKMSHAWPVSDGGLGALSYTFEWLMGYMGSPARWRTMPWMVAFFGVLVIPLGLTHIVLVISQPLVVGEWCTMCLLAAAIMLPMIPLEVDEVVAMVQHVIQARRHGSEGGSLWRIFWKGGTPEGCTPDKRSPALMELPARPWAVLRASVWGMSAPWTLLVSTALGLALLFVPWAMNVEKPASHVYHLCGSLVVVVSVIAMGEVVRLGRWLNVPLGLGLAIAPWFLEGGGVGSRLVGVVVGLIVAALAVPRGVVRERFGSWDRFVR